jgi:hypothetical protein
VAPAMPRFSWFSDSVALVMVAILGRPRTELAADDPEHRDGRRRGRVAAETQWWTVGADF